ncbi:abc-type antimicrobial peptide transport permease component [Stylonychia lemnae]|uniref:Abc-type antimicrobial peptide transport permease component n=1 Tax=Stylonychia lemnae TaxID=5949 RepID=A0A078B0E8_STYLE|nr:abc-type antimicrobial peptide transport permease component [Stylonychia lemnae]|eukprot:CDW86568.1 abc-type antimicrobial peptide transport permease component [Stylonychia lemnae]
MSLQACYSIKMTTTLYMIAINEMAFKYTQRQTRYNLSILIIPLARNHLANLILQKILTLKLAIHNHQKGKTKNQQNIEWDFFMFIILLSSIIVGSLTEKGPIIFMKLAEEQHGQVDAYLTPSNMIIESNNNFEQRDAAFLNYTNIDYQLQLVKKNLKLRRTYNLSPRKVFAGVSIQKLQMRSESDIKFEIPTHHYYQQKQNEKSSLQEILKAPSKLDEKFFLQEERDLSEIKTEKTQDLEDDYFYEEIILPDYNDLYEIDLLGNKVFTQKFLESPIVFTSINVIDTLQERKINIGTNYDFSKLRKGECILSINEADYVDVEVGDILRVEVFIDQLYIQLIKSYNIYAQENNKTLFKHAGHLNHIEMTVFPCIIRDFLFENSGKFGTSKQDSHLIIEFDQFLPHLADYLPFDFFTHQEFRQYVKKVANLTEYSDYLVMSLPSPRYKWYSNEDYDTTQRKITSYVNNFINDTGYYPVSSKLYLLNDMQKYDRAILIYNLIFKLIGIFFMQISVMLLDSILTIGVEEKSLDIGIIRMNGESKVGIVFMIITKTMMFAIPAVLISMLIAIPILSVIYSSIFNEQVSNGFSPLPSFKSASEALMIGIFIPIVSSISPIIKLMGQNLNDALSYQKTKIRAVYVEIVKTNQVNRVPIILGGVISLLFGVNIYYTLPKSLLYEDVALSLEVFFMILMAMFAGLVMIANNLQNYLEYAMIKVIFFWEKQDIKTLILNNMKVHNLRNRKTSRLFALSLGFIIFLLGSYKLLSMQRASGTDKTWGSYPAFSAWQYYQLKPQVIEPILQRNIDKIDSFTWITNEASSFYTIRKTEMSDPGQLKKFTSKVFGVTPYVFNRTNKGDFMRDYQYSSLKTGENLYSATGSQGAVISQFSAGQLGLKPHQQNDSMPYFIVKLAYENFVKKPQKVIKLRPATILSNSPYFFMSDIENGYQQRMLLSIPMYMQFMDLGTIREVSYKQLSLKLHSWVSIEQEDKLTHEIKQILDPSTVTVHSKATQMSNFDSILSWIFDIIIIITMFLCFFSTSSTMSANLYQSSKEIGIMRAVGIRSHKLVRLYIYETFILILASSLLGLLIGLSISYIIMKTYDAQYKTGVSFYFPTEQLLLITFLSMIIAIFSTYKPTKDILKIKIGNLMRMS